jgi:ABC-type transporter Mla maintaining outer membrane lipid asymmetry permease subunit MlaE
MISTIACYFGLKTENGVRGVGQAVSRTVVVCCIFIFVSNAVMGLFLIWWTGS